MNLESIISITGKPGLFKVVSQTKNGLIVEAITDGKRMPVYASEKVSALTDISIYTYEGDIPLVEVYEKLYKKTGGKASVSHKSGANELKNALQEVVEDFDQDRVYNSDLKKMFQWFNALIAADLLKPENKKTEEKKEAKKTPAKKTPAKKKSAGKKPTPKTSGAKGGAKSATPSKKGK
jgi:hypothetical protein